MCLLRSLHSVLLCIDLQSPKPCMNLVPSHCLFPSLRKYYETRPVLLKLGAWLFWEAPSLLWTICKANSGREHEKKEKSSFLLFFFCLRLTKTRVWYWIFSTEHWLLNRQSVCRAQSGNDPATRRGEHAAPSMWLNPSLNAALLISFQWRPFAVPTSTHLKKIKIFALEGAPHQYCPHDSVFKRGMWAPTLGNLWQPVAPTSKICSCHYLGWRKDRAQFAEKQSVLLGVLLSACTRHGVNLTWELPCSAIDLRGLLSAPPSS